MYSGTTISRRSGKFLGAHQKFDRVARAAFEHALPHTDFPKIKDILHFEGLNGPDGIKRKSPAKDEPWHYYNPLDPGDTALLTMIEQHTDNLVKALRQQNAERAAFEAAWLAHAVVDGLTPAHHYPLQEKLEEMRGSGLETRSTIRDKLIIRQVGDSRRQTLMKNWQFWGAKGIMTTHGLFEWGVATTVAPLRLRQGFPDGNELVRARAEGIVPLFVENARHIYHLNMYERFHKKGWTRPLAKQIREDLAPRMVKVITLAWYAAACKAYKVT